MSLSTTAGGGAASIKLATVYDLQRAMNAIGFGRTQLRAALLCSAGYFAICAELLLFVFIQSSVVTEFKLGTYSFLVLPVVTSLVGMAAGWVWGRVADSKGRQLVFSVCAFTAGVFAVASAFADSFWLLVILRTCTGIAMAGMTVVDFVLLAECCPQQGRGYVMVGITIAGALGLLYVAGMAWAILPTPSRTVFGLDPWRALIVLGALPVVVVGALRLCMKVQSPVFMFKAGKLAELEQLLLDSAASHSRMDAIRALPAAKAEEGQTDQAAAEPEQVTLSHFLQPVYRRRSIALLFAWIGAEAGYWGTTMFLPEYLAKTGAPPFASTFAMVATEVPALLITAWMVESKAFGRILTLRIALCGACLSTACIAVFAGLKLHAGFVIAASLMQYATLIPAFAILFTITPELYPTKLRGTAMAVVNVVSTIPGLLMTFLSRYLLQLPVAVYPLVWSLMFAMAALGVLNLPLKLEPRGAALAELEDEVSK